MKHFSKTLSLFALVAMLCFSSEALAQGNNDARVKTIRKAYAEALERIKAGEEDANLKNKAVIVINENFPGSGPSTFTVEYYFTTEDHPKIDGALIRKLYFMRVKELWATTPWVYEYLFNPESEELMFYFAKTPNVENGTTTERRDYFKSKETEPFLEIIDGKTYKTPKDDQWIFVHRFLMGYKTVFENLPPYFND